MASTAHTCARSWWLASTRCVGLRANRLQLKRCSRRCENAPQDSTSRRSSRRIWQERQYRLTKKHRRRPRMTTSSGRKHAGPASDQPLVPEPTFAERARTLVYLGRMGSLSTLSRKQPGFPFGSVMPYGLDGHGRPIFLISTMAMHTQNLQADARASLLVTQDDTGGDPLGASRVTLVGNVLPLPESEVAEARELYLARYANRH